MDRIENCISFLLGKAAQQVSRRTRDKLAPHRITPVQYAVLRAVKENEGCSGAELSTRLLIDSATITGIIDRLETAGLLERRPDPADRRINRMHLAAPGKQVLPTLDALMDALNLEVAADLGAAAGPFFDALRRVGTPGG